MIMLWAYNWKMARSRRYFFMILVSSLCLIVIVAKNFKATDSDCDCDVKGDAWRFDCLPQAPITKTECLTRGCCWCPPDQAMPSLENKLKVPFCYFPMNFTTYSVISIKEKANGAQINATLRRPSPYGKDVKILSTEITSITETLTRIQIRDAEHKRWEPPPLKKPQKAPNAYQSGKRIPAMWVTWGLVGQPFKLTVYDHEGCILLDMIEPLMFSDQFLQMSFLLPSHTIYGLGQHQDTLQLNTSWSQYTLWNHDGHNVVDNINLYGSHPFYLCKAGKSWYGFFLYNSNAMDVILQPSPAITWRLIGGIFDMYIFLGSTPSDVIAQYHFLIGTPVVPPYWSLGFQLCAQKYGSALATMNVVKRMRKSQIPQDVQWNDIEYAYNKRVFSRDETKFGNQTLLADSLHHRGLHYVIMADCGISNSAPSGSYAPYDLGEKMDLFIKNVHGNNLIGRVWAGSTVWPDFLDPKSQTYWLKLVNDFHGKVQFDGLWLDMNEISNFVNGSIDGCPSNSSLDYPPYLTGVDGGLLFAHTICPSARHKMSSHYNVHNLYSLYEIVRSYNALKTVRKKRPFLISRSSFPGLGSYGGTWSGDNNASWYDMYKSISAMLHMNMYGIPVTGSDICGFYGNVTEELCTRWHQLGAFYPFSRNHHAEGTKDQDPTVFSIASVNSSRKALLTRYLLLPYLYTLMWFSHRYAHTVVRPLFFEFPDDDKTYNLDSQFLWGSELMISPVLKQGERHVWAYFPKALWYDFYNGRLVNHSGGQYVRLSAPVDVINLHIRGGSILVTQRPALTTQESRKSPFGLLVALDSQGVAVGFHYFDDSISLIEEDGHGYNFLKYFVEKDALQSDLMHAGYKSEPMILGNVTVFGLTFQPSQVTLNYKPIAFVFRDKVLCISSLSVDLLHQRLVIAWQK